jgi:pimeloyl-ACP methyl ester carboxylesterase
MKYVLVPGAWAGSWIWEGVAARLRQAGHEAHTITLSGLRAADDPASVRLRTHVEDVMRFLDSERLEPVILVGHSYSGVVVGQVASQAPERVAHAVFVEAFLPVQGQSLFDVSGLGVAHERSLIAAHVGLWPPPTQNELRQQPSLHPDQAEDVARKLVGHPGATVVDPAELSVPLSDLRATFVAGEGWLSGSRETDLVDSLRREATWTFRTIGGGHWPMVTVPEQLTSMLLELEWR